MTEEEPTNQKKKERPSARNIVGAIFGEGKQAAEKKQEESSLFRSAPPGIELPPAGSKKINIAVLQKQAAGWFHQAKNFAKQLIVTPKHESPPIVFGEWTDYVGMPVGLDVGATAVRAVQLLKNGVGWQLVNCAIRPLTSGKTSTEFTQEIERNLREIFPKKTEHLTCVSSFASSTAIARVFRMPLMSRGELKQAVAWEFQEQLAVRVEDWHFDFAPLPTSGEKENKERLVLVSAVSKQELNTHITILKSVGLKPLAVEVKPLPTWELLSGYPWPPNEAVLLIELGAQNSYVVIVVNALPALIHPLDFNGEMLTKVIQRMLQLSHEEAEKFKGEVGLSQTEPDSQQPTEASSAAAQKSYQAYLAIQPFIDRMVNEIEQAFKYVSFRVFQSSVRSFSKVLLSGKTSLLKGFKEILAQRLAVPVDYVQPFEAIKIDDSSFDRGELERESLSLVTALGLAERREGF